MDFLFATPFLKVLKTDLIRQVVAPVKVEGLGGSGAGRRPAALEEPLGAALGGQVAVRAGVLGRLETKQKEKSQG